jgi:AcrR family transcriptional regulator
MEKTKKNPKQSRSQILVGSIQEAATRILDGTTNKKFTTNHIAELAGVSVGSLYQYFKNKENILQDLLLKNMTNGLDKIFKDLESKDQIDAHSFIHLIIKGQFDLWENKAEFSKKIIKYAPQFIPDSLLQKNNEIMLSYIKSKIAEYNIQNIKQDNLDLAIILAINCVRTSIYLFYTSALKTKDYATIIQETTTMVENYLIETKKGHL